MQRGQGDVARSASENARRVDGNRRAGGAGGRGDGFGPALAGYSAGIGGDGSGGGLMISSRRIHRRLTWGSIIRGVKSPSETHSGKENQ